MPADSDNESHGGDLRILHWNIHSWRDASAVPNQDAVVGLIRDTRPHVVSLVEVDEPLGMPSSLETVASSCGYSWIFAPAFEFGHDTGAGGFGNALLTTLPVAAVQQWRLFTPAGPYDGSEPSEPRSAVLAKLGISGHHIWVASTHLPRSDPTARAAAARRLTALTERLDRPWIICGDFNTPPADLPGHESVTIAPDPAQPTYPAEHPVEAIDFCITSHGASTAAEVLAAPGSDHLPVLAIMHIPPRRAGALPDL